MPFHPKLPMPKTTNSFTMFTVTRWSLNPKLRRQITHCDVRVAEELSPCFQKLTILFYQSVSDIWDIPNNIRQYPLPTKWTKNSEFSGGQGIDYPGPDPKKMLKNQTVMLALVKICRPTSISCLTSLSSASSRSGAGGRKRRRITRKKKTRRKGGENVSNLGAKPIWRQIPLNKSLSNLFKKYISINA